MASLESVSYKKIRCRKKPAASDIVFNVFIYGIFIIFAIVIIYPIINMLAYSFSYGADSLKGRIYIFPRVWSLETYKDVLFERKGLRYGAVTTISRTVIGTAAGVFANALLAYTISRKNSIFKHALSLFWIITIYAQGGLITTLLLYWKMGLKDTFWVYVIPGLVSGIYLLVMRTYMKSIPDSLEESAKLEGAGFMRIFWSIISPICKPVYAAIAVFIATTHWNSWFDAMIYNRFNPEYTTLQYELMKIITYVSGGVITENSPRPYPVSVITLRAAVSVLTMLPILIIYPFFQKYYVAGLTIRGIKD